MPAIMEASLKQARQAVAGGDLVTGRRAYHQASLLVPESAEALLGLATVCLADHDPVEALEHARAAAKHCAGWRVEFVQASATQQLRQADRTAYHLQQALADPELPAEMRVSLMLQLADLQLNTFGDTGGAASTWSSVARNHQGLLLKAELGKLIAVMYEGGLNARAISDGFTSLAGMLGPLPSLPVRRRVAARSRPRIGLLSPQFCASPVGFLTMGVLRELARSADLIFFDRGAKQDWAQAAFRQMALHWLPCAALDAAQLRRLLAEADLDALIDLGGWTDVEAMRAVAARPVLRQLKWVGGQSATTGLRCFNGLVTDARQAPAAAEALYTERLLRARHGYVTYQPPPYMPQLAAAAAHPPVPRGRPAPGVYALVSHPAKISKETVRALGHLKPRKLILIDHRWRHEGTRRAAGSRLGALLDVAEFMTPVTHPDYLQALVDLNVSFMDTMPYAMGLTAIELRLLGKHIVSTTRSPVAPMSQRHCVAHLGARRFDHHAELANQLLHWCRGGM